MSKNKLLIGILFIILSILLGAFGAHGLKSKISTESISILHTATQYLMYNGLGLMAIYAIASKKDMVDVKWSGNLIVLGTLLFSGSIVLLSLRSLITIIPTSILGPMTPIGGSLMIIGWGLLLYTFLKSDLT